MLLEMRWKMCLEVGKRKNPLGSRHTNINSSLYSENMLIQADKCRAISELSIKETKYLIIYHILQQ